MPKLDSILLASTNPEALGAWYAEALQADEDSAADQYRMLSFGGFYLIIDRRDDIAAANPDPARVILNFDVADARQVAERLDGMGVNWVSPIEDRGGSLFATATDPDGNYVQIVQLSEEDRAAMAQQ